MQKTANPSGDTGPPVGPGVTSVSGTLSAVTPRNATLCAEASKRSRQDCAVACPVMQNSPANTQSCRLLIAAYRFASAPGTLEASRGNGRSCPPGRGEPPFPPRGGG